METIKLEVNKKIYDKLMELLNQFKPEDLKIIDEEKERFLQEKKYLDEQLDLIDSGKAKFISIEEMDNLLEETIREYESKNP